MQVMTFITSKHLASIETLYTKKLILIYYYMHFKKKTPSDIAARFPKCRTILRFCRLLVLYLYLIPFALPNILIPKRHLTVLLLALLMSEVFCRAMAINIYKAKKNACKIFSLMQKNAKN